jgi:Flp pilus assembly protein TadD
MISYKNGGTVTYTGKILYSPEMNVSELFLVPIIYCSKEGTYDTIEELLNRGKHTIMPDVKIADGVIHTSRYIFDDEIAIIAFHAYKKENIVTQKAIMYFLVNRYNLNWKIPLNKLDANKEKFAAIDEFLTLGWKIKDINISGWASPEGEELFNRDLSENRSTTAYNYMVKEMKRLAKQEGSKLKVEDPKEEVAWDITWHGPDWDAFMTSVENSSMTDKNAILNVIRSAGQSKREEEIRNMILIYPEIERDFLPNLRRAEIAVNCYEPKRSDEQIMAYGLSYPDSLKVNEMLYAATFYDDDEDQLAIYKSVIENFPKCYRGYNNAGQVLIDMGEYDEAGEMLDKANELKPNDAEIINNLGVLSCHLSEYDEAETYFLEAQDLGADEDYNLAILAILDGDYSKAQNLMSGIECKHNLGLLQVLNKDYETAQKTLECAPPEAITYYLLAITGARQDNTQFLYDNLMKAIEMDAELKNQARDDREFLKYNELPEFQAIVQ